MHFCLCFFFKPDIVIEPVAPELPDIILQGYLSAWGCTNFDSGRIRWLAVFLHVLPVEFLLIGSCYLKAEALVQPRSILFNYQWRLGDYCIYCSHLPRSLQLI